MIVSLFILLVVYLTLFSVVEIAQHQMVGWLVSKELERIWKEEVVALFLKCCSGHFLEGIGGKTQRERQNNWSPKGDMCLGSH
jgi:hypothetical protein